MFKRARIRPNVDTAHRAYWPESGLASALSVDSAGGRGGGPPASSLSVSSSSPSRLLMLRLQRQIKHTTYITRQYRHHSFGHVHRVVHPASSAAAKQLRQLYVYVHAVAATRALRSRLVATQRGRRAHQRRPTTSLVTTAFAWWRRLAAKGAHEIRLWRNYIPSFFVTNHPTATNARIYREVRTVVYHWCLWLVGSLPYAGQD